MTSILEQENLANSRNEGNIRQSAVPIDPPSSGYVSVRIKEETPIFTKNKMRLDLPHDVTHMAVANNWVMCLMSNQALLRVFILNPQRNDEVLLDKYLNGLKVSKMFLDPTGHHLLLALVPRASNMLPELVYLHRTTDRLKRIDKVKNHEITSIAFNHDLGSETTTGPILLGTSKGLIFETEIGIDGEKMFQPNWKQVFDIGQGESCPITGLDFYKMPNTKRYIICASTVDRLYKFQETLRPDDKQLQNIFNAYLNIPEQIKTFEQSQTSLNYSKLRFIMSGGSKFPTHLGWLTEPGILLAVIDQKAESPDFILDREYIPFPQEAKAAYKNETEPKKIKAPKSFILTNFHAVLLYPDHVTAISLLNHQVIYEEYFSEQYGKLVDIIKDPISESVYVYSPRAIFRFKVTNEKRNVWRMYLEKNQFELAFKYCQDNPAHGDIVLCKQAEASFDAGNYIESALIYSATQTSFERVCLKFLELPDKKPLMIFLRNRLEKLKPEDKTQITMLVVWIVEMYLTEIGRAGNDAETVRQLQKEFDNFMNSPQVVKCIHKNRSVIYDLMGSHGDSHNLTMLTTVNKDYESVINQYINQNKFHEALSILRGQSKSELYYKYCPILLEEIPKETIGAIIAQRGNLDPLKLLPTLISAEGEESLDLVIQYLEFAIHSLCSAEVALHNFLIKLYAMSKHDKLMAYLETQGRDTTLIQYDVNYALRVCEEHQASTACVFLQCLLELWFPAVDLALTFDSKLAQTTASQPQDAALKRKLWLRIAEHEIKGKNDVKKALKLLKDCDLLRIEDLLPFFSDFQKIDDFKEAICDALKEYNLKIQEQQRDMEESAKSADRVRSELQTFRNRSVTIGAQEQCSICEIYLLLKPFFIFPCGHKFHGDCLEKQIIPLLTIEQNRKLNSLKQQLENMLVQQSDPSGGQQTQVTTTREQIKYEIENILAADCLFCGVMIDAIDQPFIEDWDQVNVDWQ